MDSDKTSHELTVALLRAADGLPGALRDFYEALLRSRVWFPLRSIKKGEGRIERVGDRRSEESDFVVAEFEGRRFVPIFSEPEFVGDWAEQDVTSSAKEFSSLLWLLDDETHFYLNAKQEVGKEITLWEIELLRRGLEAVPELVAEETEEIEISEEVEVRSSSDLFPELKKQLLPVLEIYEELEEAFLISVKQSSGLPEVPMLGIRYAVIAPDKREYVRSELENIARSHLGEAAGLLNIVDNLDSPICAHGEFFSDATPFYFSRATRKKPGAAASAIDALAGVFRKKKP